MLKLRFLTKLRTSLGCIIAPVGTQTYHQNQNPAEGRYCTLKSWTNTIMNRSGAPADCWLLCMIHASYILNYLSCEALGGNVPLGMLYGVSPDISILLLYTFYQPVFYPSQNQSYPSASEERAARWVGFGEHVGDALTHKLLDDDTKKILYRSAVRPSDSVHPNKRLLSDGGECSQTPKPIVFVRSRQDNSQSATKPMAEYNPDDLIGRTFLLPKNEQGERLRATIKRKVIETSKLLDDQHDNAIDKINFHLDVGQGRTEAIMSYVQIWTILTNRSNRRTSTSLAPSQAIKDLSHLNMKITKAVNTMSWLNGRQGRLLMNPSP